MAVDIRTWSKIATVDDGGPDCIRYFVCDTEAERPSSGLLEGDRCYTKDTDRVWVATNATTWLQVGAGGGATWGSITGTLSSQTDLQSALDAKAATPHSITAATHTFPGGTTTYLRADGTFATPTGGAIASPFTGAQATGSFTIATGQFGIQGKRLELVSTDRATLEGAGRLIISG